MSVYQPLADFLGRQKGDRWEASFTDVEEVLGRPLPGSAYRHSAWWANQSTPGHSQTRGWRSSGWRTAGLDLERKRVRFERDHEGGTVSERPAFAGDAQLLDRARALSGIDDHVQLIDEALKALIAREAARQLAAMGGTMSDFAAAPRDRR